MRIKKYFFICFMLIAVLMLLVGNRLSADALKKTVAASISVRIGDRDVTKKTYKMSVGDAVRLRVGTKPKKASDQVTFRSSKPKVVSVTKNGKVAALRKGTARITLTVSGKKYKKTSSYVKISVQDSGNSQTEQSPSDSGDETVESPEKITVFVDENTLVRDVMNAPALKGFGRLLFPVDKTISSSLTLGQVGSILTWYHHVDSSATVEVINTLMTRASGGETVFYDIYTDEEKRADPDKADTGLFFYKVIINNVQKI